MSSSVLHLVLFVFWPHVLSLLQVQPNNYCTFYDDLRQNWSLMFESEKASLDFCKEVSDTGGGPQLRQWLLFDDCADNRVMLFIRWRFLCFYVRQVCLAKANSAASLDAVVIQDLSLGEGQVVENGDSLEVVYTGWLLQNHTIGQVTHSPRHLISFIILSSVPVFFFPKQWHTTYWFLNIISDVWLQPEQRQITATESWSWKSVQSESNILYWIRGAAKVKSPQKHLLVQSLCVWKYSYWLIYLLLLLFLTFFVSFYLVVWDMISQAVQKEEKIRCMKGKNKNLFFVFFAQTWGDFFISLGVLHFPLNIFWGGQTHWNVIKQSTYLKSTTGVVNIFASCFSAYQVILKLGQMLLPLTVSTAFEIESKVSLAGTEADGGLSKWLHGKKKRQYCQIKWIPFIQSPCRYCNSPFLRSTFLSRFPTVAFLLGLWCICSSTNWTNGDNSMFWKTLV